MGRLSLVNDLTSPFELSLADLVAVQRMAIYSRARLTKRHLGQSLSTSKIRGRGVDFIETRNYYPGDDIRLMDWRVTARTNKPHVKVFQVERERPVLIVYDFSPTMFFGTQVCFKTVLAAKFAALLAWTAKAHGDRVGGLVVSHRKQELWLPHTRNQTLINFLKAMSLGTQQYRDFEWSASSMEHAQLAMIAGLKELLKVLKPGTLILLLSDWYYDLDALKPYFFELRQYHDIISYQVLDPLELKLPGPGIFPMTDGNKGVVLNAHAMKTQQHYEQFCFDRIQKTMQFFKKIAIPYHSFNVVTDLVDLVGQSLLRRLGE